MLILINVLDIRMAFGHFLPMVRSLIRKHGAVFLPGDGLPVVCSIISKPYQRLTLVRWQWWDIREVEKHRFGPRVKIHVLRLPTAIIQVVEVLPCRVVLLGKPWAESPAAFHWACAVCEVCRPRSRPAVDQHEVMADCPRASTWPVLMKIWRTRKANTLLWWLLPRCLICSKKHPLPSRICRQ